MKNARQGMLALLLVGCGGGGAKYRVDDASLASVSMDDKKGVFAAQNELNQAKAELEKARADVNSVDTALDVAENDLKSAKLQLDTAKLNNKAAEQSADVNSKNNASRDVHIAEMGVKAADAKVDWLAKKKKWLKRTRDAAEDHVAAADARAELEKAKVAQAKGIRPNEKFDVMNFETDNMEKQTTYSNARMEADRLRADVDNLERNYQNQQQIFDQSKSAAAR